MLKDTVIEKWTEAFKAKDSVLKSAFEAVKAKILVEEKSGKYTLPLTDDVIVTIITKEVKELKETQTYYKESDTQFNDIQRKIDALSEYLPKQLTEEEVKKIINKFVAQEKNKGKLTGLTIKEVGNRFDKSKISQLVSEVLSWYSE